MTLRRIGLTGRIGSGKSTVGARLREHGAVWIDADAVARTLLAPGGLLEDELLDRLGAHRRQSVLDAGGRLDRAALRTLISRDAEAKGILESLTHPAIVAAVRDAFNEADARGETLAVVEATLLLDSALPPLLEGVIVVTAPDDRCVQRAAVRDNKDPADVAALLAVQPSEARMRQTARWVLPNNADVSDLLRLTDDLWRELTTEDAPASGAVQTDTLTAGVTVHPIDGSGPVTIRLPEGIELPEDYVVRSDDMVVGLTFFQGPLDLLLFLIRRHRMDIFDIPMADITARFFEYLSLLDELRLDTASEFIVMAATLLHIKSRMLLPDPAAPQDEDIQEGDPRAELVKRLLEYQRYLDAAQNLEHTPWLGRDEFVREAVPEETLAEQAADLVEVSAAELMQAFESVLARIRTQKHHAVELDEASVEQMIRRLIRRLRVQEEFPLSVMLEGVATRGELVALFLALLELTRLGGVRILQHRSRGEIFLSARLDSASLKDMMPM